MTMEAKVLSQLQRIRARYNELTDSMGRPDIASDFEQLNKLAKERADIEPVVELLTEYEATQQALDESRAMLNESDPEIKELAQAEFDAATARLDELTVSLRRALLPRDPRDARNVIVEIRAGAGGEEAALFGAELYRAYARYAEQKRWQVEIMSASESEKGGFKEVVFEIRGDGAYSRMKYESGVHRVQRVPETETQGRIHTSTATVAVLPEVDEVEVAIEDKDLRTDIYHSSGAGGQNVNKVATAVRITHIPSGLVVACQEERSQLKNRTKAMTMLRSRLFDMEQQKQTAEIGADRRGQVGTGDRSEKIRTYNFPQDRITDHRVGLTVHNVSDRLAGNLDDIIDAVATADEAQRLENLE